MTDPARVAELLRRLPLFAELDAAVLERLAARSVVRHVSAGTVLFTAGEACRGLYVIGRGRVRIYRVSPEGREQVLHVEGPGRPVGEVPLFDGGPYPASGVTLDDSELVFLPREEFERAYRESPEAAQIIIRTLGRRLRHMVQLTETLAFRDVAARLALLLAGYADRLGRPTERGVELHLVRTQEELSYEIGTARESVSRAFRRLERKGLLQRLDTTHLLIPDPARLRAFARS
ncbi:MAG TPA: Crp/Fnr family transcriptional regulator [Gemmatimonadales bacterium]|nr:Crp/Fnr family transcriptional regulator [Gemmatimonadales bacterium]